MPSPVPIVTAYTTTAATAGFSFTMAGQFIADVEKEMYEKEIAKHQMITLTAEQAYLCMKEDEEFIVRSNCNGFLQRFKEGYWEFGDKTDQKWYTDSPINQFEESFKARSSFMNAGFSLEKDPNNVLLNVLFKEGDEIIKFVASHPFWGKSTAKEVV